MPETSRECIVWLLDETSFTVPIKSTLLGSELLDMAASHNKVKEKEYFGLYTEGDGYKNWLELDKPVLDPSQDLSKGSQPVKIHFSFKYFVSDLTYLQDYVTVDLLYLQSRLALMRGDILTDDDTVFELAACALQAQHGDFKSDADARQHLNHMPVLPVHVFKSQSVHYCENEVIKYYKMMHNLSRGEAVFKYLEIIQSLPMYSVHYFEVKDKREMAMWLGVGPNGICQCPHSDRNEVNMRFQWIQLQNIYYRDRKFSMEIYQNTKPSRKGVGFGPVTVHAWYGANSKVVMAIWKMARDQHMFYRSKRTNARHAPVGMSTTEIIRQLNKLHKANISPSSSHSSLSIESGKSNQTQASAEAVAAAKVAQEEMYTALLARRTALVTDFERKAARYKEILIKEMQITGIPPEGLTAEEIEKMRKKFGVSFKFSRFVLDDRMLEGSEVDELEKQLEIQSSIIKASKTLYEQASNRKLKKDRKKEIKQMEDKYQRLEERLNDLKRVQRSSVGSASSAKFHVDSPTAASLQVPGSAPVNHRRSGTPSSGSIDDTYLASMIFDSPANTTASANSSALQKSPHHKSTSALSDLQSTVPGASSTPQQQQQPVVSQKPHPSKHSHSSVATSQSGHKNSLTSDQSYNNSSFLSSSSRTYYDDFDLSPSSSVVSTANTSTVSQGGRRDDRSLRDFDLTEDILHHFSRKERNTPPMPPNRVNTHPHLSPRRANVGGSPNPKSHLNIPAASSPVTRYKRASSPDLNFPVDNRGRFNVSQPSGLSNTRRSISPEPTRLTRGEDFDKYSSSYHPPSNFPRNLSGALSNVAASQQQRVKASAAAVTGFNKTSALQQQRYNEVPSSEQSTTTSSAAATTVHPHQRDGRGDTGNQTQRVSSQDMHVAAAAQPQSGSHVPGSNSRKQSEDVVDLQEMLKIWAESSKNPFSGEGTLV